VNLEVLQDQCTRTWSARKAESPGRQRDHPAGHRLPDRADPKVARGIDVAKSKVPRTAGSRVYDWRRTKVGADPRVHHRCERLAP
jgi:hypothetical protein